MTDKQLAERAARWAKYWAEHPTKPKSSGEAHSKAVKEGQRRANERKKATAEAASRDDLKIVID